MKTRTLSWLALLSGLLLAGTAFAAGTQFSADMVQKASGQTQTMRYYQGDQKVRTEMKTPDGQQAVSILDMQARKMLTLMPAEKMYMEIPLGADTAAWAADDKTREEYYEVKKVGTEKVNGYLCDKYELIPKKQGLERSTTWIAQKLGYPIRTVGKNFAMELTNIKEGTQPASLFAVPKGYQKMPGMDEYYRGMMQQNGDATPRSGQRAAEEDDAGSDAMPEALRKGLRGLFGKE
ncbi:MAG: DUF4412 domain-containing protein [Pseudomonadota bacterium]